MSTRESKKLIYKLASGTNNHQTLQEALTAALWKFKKPSARVEPLGIENHDVRFVNVRRQHQGMLIGLFHKLTKGASQLVIKMGETGQKDDAWEVVPVTAKASPEEANDFIQGTLFFGVWKNHVILHQTSACRADQFQDHATWLVAKMFEDGEQPVTAPLICLADPLPPDLRKKSTALAKKVTFGTALDSALVPAGKSVQGVAGAMTKAKEFFTPIGPVWEAVKLIFATRSLWIGPSGAVRSDHSFPSHHSK